MHPYRHCSLLLCALALLTSSHDAHAAVDPDGAALVFAEAKEICERDNGALWGQSLCGPMLLVDPMDRSVIANQADGAGALKPVDGGRFTGTLSDDVVVANTPTQWSGTRWTQLLWPVTFEQMIRKVTTAHELFHRIQPGLGLTRPEAGNRHLDTLQGRLLLQLEWRALAQALMADGVDARRARVADALAFRSERYRRFPDAAADENALEINEGIAEYTGVRLGLTTSGERTAYAIFDLSRFLESPTFVRSFAYASGPAYGLLLDQADPAWRSKLASGHQRLDQLLSTALSLPEAPAGSIDERSRRYDDGTLLAAETQRDRQRRSLLAGYRAALVDGPLLTLPTRHPNYRFNPQTLVPLEGLGTVYPTLGLTDDWGELTVERGGALVYRDKPMATVSAAGVAADHLKGDGWTLRLKPGWSIVAGARAGDWTVTQTGP